MATTLSTAARNAACDAVVDRVDLGAGPGKIRLKSAGAVVIAEVVLGDPAFGNAANGVATANGLPLAGAGIAAAGAGTPAVSFDVTDSDDVVSWSGAVGTGAGELDVDNVNIADGQVITISACTHTQPATV